MLQALHRRIEDERDDLVELTRSLVRVPTVNPPGGAHAPCAELMGDRLRRRGFEAQYPGGAVR